jgi:two-component sensor histidine kinase
LTCNSLEHAPSPMAKVEGAAHMLREVNHAFCRYVDCLQPDVVGKPLCELMPNNPECLMLLDEVYRTGKPGILQEQEHAEHGPVSSSYAMWPVTTIGCITGVVIQITETVPLHARTRTMNEALVLGSLRQHELTEIAESANARLQEEIAQRVQSERDALMLTKEISHRIKNNLQIVISLIGQEIRQTPAQYAQGYIAMEARISGIADLYDLISHSNHVDAVPLDGYLRELAQTMSATLLEPLSGIKIEVESVALELDTNRAVPFGLLVNELATNAIKHAFPSGSGLIRLSIARVGDQIELIVADNGIGIAAKTIPSVEGRHGSDYVEIFVRQLGGIMTVAGSAEAGTVIRVLFPLTALAVD